MKHLEKHTGYYLSLFLLFLFCFVLMVQFANDKQMQAVVVVLTAVLYVIWGILHHKRMHDVTPKIVIEYVLIGSLGISLVLFFLTGGFL